MTTIRTRRRGFAAALLAAVAVTVALAGCSATTPGAGAGAETGSSAGAGGELKSSDADAMFAEWNDKFQDCMKDKGFDLSSGVLEADDADALNEAANACYEKVGEPPADPDVPSNEEINEQMLAFAKCMREAGYDYPDPKIDPNGGVAMSPAMPADWDTADIDRCSKEAGMGEAGVGVAGSIGGEA
ncbi:hypothetical protein LQ757_09545 [Agromyces sp. SYSU K20354]|uniref:hypothetical protein n=1 Tax=Agromyces cavernae TaxID=2898659 RepID=UPI001E4BAD4A|nr:hypothetical protein [Agromyces cavernae]MCD2442517.1 hypothetical protein [Agromyces cavernae]